MDVVDDDSETRSKSETSQWVTEILNSEPKDRYNHSRDLVTVEFGNTGLTIYFGSHGIRGDNEFDFVPEKNDESVDGKGPKYASILCVSMLEVYKFIRNPEKMSEMGLYDFDITEMEAFTNNKMVEAICSLFSKSGTSDIVTNSGEGTVTIDLRKFKTLDEENPLIKYLARVSEWARNETVTYDKSIEIPR
jgi:hypothetical protein